MKTLLVVLGLVAALTAGPASARPAEDPPLRLQDAVSAALERNPTIASTRAGRDLAVARLREARAMWMPRVDATETIMRSDNPVFVFGSLLEQGRFGAQHFDPAFLNDPDALDNFRLALNVRYTVFDQLRRLNAVRGAGNAVEQADFGSNEARQRIRVETVSRFYGLFLAIQKVAVASEAVAAAEANAASMRARFEQGLLVESDLLAAEVQLASFRQQLIEGDGEVEIARAALAMLIQRPLSEPLTVEGTIPESEFPEVPLSAAIERALAERGELKTAQSATENAALQLRTARGSFLPRVDTFASWGQSGSKLTSGDPDTAIGVIVGVNLFDGGKHARIGASRAELEAARSAEISTRDRVTMEVVTAWHRARSARERIGVAARSAESATTAARIVSDRYNNGLTTITEQLRAQTALVSGRLALLAARFDYVINYAELMRSTGGLNDVEDFD